MSSPAAYICRAPPSSLHRPASSDRTPDQSAQRSNQSDSHQRRQPSLRADRILLSGRHAMTKVSKRASGLAILSGSQCPPCSVALLRALRPRKMRSTSGLAEPTLFWPQQKIVIRVSLASEKTRSKAMALVAKADGTRAQALHCSFHYPLFIALYLVPVDYWPRPPELTVRVRACRGELDGGHRRRQGPAGGGRRRR